MRIKTQKNRFRISDLFHLSKIKILFKKAPILNIFLIIFIFVLSSSIIISLFPDLSPFENRYLDINFNNILNDLIIPFENSSIQETLTFRYPELLNLKSLCFKRNKYNIELLRFLGLNPYFPSKKQPYTLVVGSNTALGSAIIKKLQNKKIPIIIFDTVSDFDISILISKLHKNFLIISQAIVCFQPSPFRKTKIDSTIYYETFVTTSYKRLCECFTSLNIPYVIAMQPPYLFNFISVNEWFESNTVLVPYFVDNRNSFDLENPFIRAAQECNLKGKTEILLHSGYNIHSISAEDAADHVLTFVPFKKLEKSIISGYDSISIEDGIDVFQQIFPNCEITTTIGYNHNNIQLRGIQSQILGKKLNVSDLIIKNFSNYKNFKSKDPYLSIIITGRHDKEFGGFLSLLQRFIDVIGRSLDIVSLADIELIIVEYSPLNDFKPLIKLLSIPISLKGKIKIITVPQSIHLERTKLFNSTRTFFHYFAKNIGIRRASGKFILVTNPDELIPTHFFEYVAAQQFKEGILYRANRFDVKNTYASRLSLNSIIDLVDQPFLYSENLDIAAHCYEEISGSFLMQTPRDFSSDIICSSQDFLLTSKNMWFSIGGFTEFPDNCGDEVVLTKFMRIIPGFLQHYLFEPILHLDQHNPHQSQDLKNFDKMFVKKQMICNGRSNIVENFINWPEWGLPNESFSIVVL